MIVGLLLVLSVPTAAQQRDRDRDDRRRGPEITERFSRTIRIGRAGAFDLSNVSGDIVVTGNGGDEVRIEAIKRTRHRDEAAGRARLQEIRIDVREQGNRVDVKTEYTREGRDVPVAVEYTVIIPQDASVRLKSVSGDVRVTNIRGELSTQSVSGDVTATAARKLRTIASVSGDVFITDAQSEGQVSATTVSGDLRIRDLKAGGIDTNTVSGDVTLDGCDCGRASVQTVSGDVQYTGSLARDGRYELQSHSGDILLAVATSGFDVEANTFSGDVRSDYPVTLTGNLPVTGDLRRRRSATIRGSFGDAGAILSLRSFSGDIAITKR
jgi:DUF4097 and DUF4098 domain-containing protein YvlB